MNYIDIAVIILILYFCFQGFKRGFVKTMFDTVGVIASIFISKSYNYITEEFLLNNTKLFARFHDFFEPRLSNELIQTIINSAKTQPEIQKIISTFVTSNNMSQIDPYAAFVDNMSLVLIRSISFVFTYLVVYFLLVLIASLIDTIFKLPILNIANSFLGLITGALKAMIILYLIFAIGSPFMSVFSENLLAKDVASSRSSEIFYKNNIILKYLESTDFYKN